MATGHQIEVASLRCSILPGKGGGPGKLQNPRTQARRELTWAQRKASLITLFGALLLAQFPMTTRSEEMKSTYGQRIVAAVLMGEARGEGEVGMTAVAEVIRNRANSASNSPLAIVLKKREFSCLNGTTPDALHEKVQRMKLYPVALRIAKTCYNAPEKLPNLTRGATFFDHMTNTPPWLGDVRPVSTVGNHRFYVPK